MVGWDHPTLKQVAEPVDFEKTGRTWLLGLYTQMREVLKHSNDGVGLAAPQVNISKRVIMVWPRCPKGYLNFDMRKAPTLMINPKIIKYTGVKKSYRGGCLSYPGVFTDVERHTRIIVEFNHIQGEHYQFEVDGVEALIIQHEVDHLDGICRVGDYWRKTMKQKERVARISRRV